MGLKKNDGQVGSLTAMARGTVLLVLAPRSRSMPPKRSGKMRLRAAVRATEACQRTIDFPFVKPRTYFRLCTQHAGTRIRFQHCTLPRLRVRVRVSASA